MNGAALGGRPAWKVSPPRWCHRGGPKPFPFGSPADQLTWSRGFAPPPHDGFALSGTSYEIVFLFILRNLLNSFWFPQEFSDIVNLPLTRVDPLIMLRHSCDRLTTGCARYCDGAGVRGRPLKRRKTSRRSAR